VLGQALPKALEKPFSPTGWGGESAGKSKNSQVGIKTVLHTAKGEENTNKNTD